MGADRHQFQGIRDEVRMDNQGARAIDSCSKKVVSWLYHDCIMDMGIPEEQSSAAVHQWVRLSTQIN